MLKSKQIELEFYNSYFNKQADITLKSNFTYDETTKLVSGSFSLKRKEIEVKIDAHIPENYPFSDIKFICCNFEGYPHQNYDNSLCLNTPFVNHIYSRLELDVEKLRGWILQYVEQNKIDSHYEYSPANFTETIQFIFQEGKLDLNRFENSKFGEMNYSLLNYHTNQNKISRLTILCQKIGNKNLFWSSQYKKSEKFIGIWVYIDREPNLERKKKIRNWQDLIPLFPDGFLSYFNHFCQKTAKYKLGGKTFQDNIFLCIGYDIPKSNKEKEINWDLILIPKSDFPRKNKLNILNFKNYKKEIQWERTVNSEYDRFFGRGALSPKISNSKVLIIGIGALGSSLAEILVRGGIKNLDINDLDTVEIGNICRSAYSFSQVGSSKNGELKAKLMNISPFVEVNVNDTIEPVSEKSSLFTETKDLLSKYDIIFDCSANNGLIQMLSLMQLENKVFYLSMTNKAKEMICITNIDSKSLIERRNQMLYSLDGLGEAEFREGTGCWHPTFEASYFDINQLLHYTIKKINTSFSLNLPMKSFYSYYENEVIGSSEDIKFHQKELNLTITIESSCLDYIFEIIWQHYPKEFGGIFIGSYINDYKEVVISDVLIPENYRSSFLGFQADPNDLNKQLKKVYQKHNQQIVYIGDWHSHPNSNNKYSQPDFKSIKDIAKSPKVNTHNPVLMIAAFGKDYFDPGFYVFSQDKLYKYERVK